MANINIKISDDLHKNLKIRSIMKNITLKDCIIQELQEGLVVLKKHSANKHKQERRRF